MYTDNKNKVILIPGERPTQRLNDITIYQIKAKDSKIKYYTLHLGNISKHFTVNNMKKTGLNRIVKLFSADFDPIDTSNILYIHKYLMKEK